VEPLRVRRADAAPVVGAQELFGKAPESAIGDPELECPAVRLLAAIDLDIVRNGGRVSLATNRELARMCGRAAKKERSNDEWVRRWLRSLEDRGHVETAPVRSIAGNPRGIRPLANLKRRGAPTETWGCNPTKTSQHPHENVGGAPRKRGPGPTENVGPILREEREKENSRVAGSIGSVESDRPTPATQPEKEAPLATVEQVRAAWRSAGVDLEAIGRRVGARKSPGRWTGKSTSGAQTRNSVPDAKDCTGQPTELSRHDPTESNITPNI
jgi:hypothetical protein